MMTPAPSACARGLALLAALLAAGCSGNLAGESRPSAAPAAAPAAPPVAMAGRWRLVSANGGACGVTFGAGATAGTIAPEGGCPANFFTSRHWVFEQGALVIQDHRRRPLVQMKQNAGRFEGELPNKEIVSLER